MSRLKQLHRRTFLKGAGATVALPLLESMLPARAAEAEKKTAVRMAFVFFPNGCIKPAWTPEKAGENYELSETLAPLKDFQSEFNVISGLAQDNGRAKGDGAGDHARCAASYLTGAHPYKTDGEKIRNGISVDQVGAQEIRHLTPLASLELGIERGRNAGNCDSGYSCAYSSNVSWKTATTPTAKEVNPKLVFERLFGGRDGQNKKREHYRKSILDLVAGDADRLRKRLGRNDRAKVDEYFTSVRETEQRLARFAEIGRQAPKEFAVPEGIPEDLSEHIRLMYDLMVLAFQTDSTRISTFMLANAGSNRAYTQVGVKEGHHSLSHHQNDDAKTSQIRKIDHFLATQFAYFIEKLHSVKEGEGTLLDNSMILYGSGLGDGNSHQHHDLPILLAGRGGGTIKTGRHLKLEKEVPLTNLFLSMLDRVGASVASMGDSSGRLEILNG